MTKESQTREDVITKFLADEHAHDVSGDASAHGAELLPPPHEAPDQNAEDDGVFIAWEGPEFEVYERDKQWYIVASVILLLIIAYAVIINSPIMAITFILIGVVGYIYLQKEPRDLVFAVTAQGVFVGNELFSFDEIESFWIFYEPPHTYLLSLALRNRTLPYVHIPLHQVDPVQLHEELIQFVPERRQEIGFIDTLERLLHM